MGVGKAILFMGLGAGITGYAYYMILKTMTPNPCTTEQTGDPCPNCETGTLICQAGQCVCDTCSWYCVYSQPITMEAIYPFMLVGGLGGFFAGVH